MAQLQTNKQKELRKRIYQFRKNYISKSLKFTVEHFLLE